jgi:hypothetical protein
MAVQAFGFEKHLVIPGENGTVAHAQLTFGSGMIMLGSAREDEFGQWVTPPRATGGIGTQSAYVIHRTRLPRHPRLPRKGEGVTHVSGTICHLCLGPLILRT